MNHCCYILYSVKLNKHYIGYSSDLEQRLIFHENAENRKFTHNSDDWVVKLEIKCLTKSQAIAVESHIKKMKSKIYIENLLLYPEMIAKLLEKYKDC